MAHQIKSSSCARSGTEVVIRLRCVSPAAAEELFRAARKGLADGTLQVAVSAGETER